MKKCLGYLMISVLIFGLDQLTKYYFAHHLQLYKSYPVIPGVNLVLLHNHGAAFSFLSDAGGWQRWFFLGLSIIVSGGLIGWLARLPAGFIMRALALSLIIGGALGNALDRLRLGAVIDFIDVYYKHWHWPAFNLADAAICLGAFFFYCLTERQLRCLIEHKSHRMSQRQRHTSITVSKALCL